MKSGKSKTPVPKKIQYRALVWMRLVHVFAVVKIKAENATVAAARADSLAKSYNAKFVELVK